MAHLYGPRLNGGLREGHADNDAFEAFSWPVTPANTIGTLKYFIIRRYAQRPSDRNAD
jgi:hypothetical protein